MQFISRFWRRWQGWLKIIGTAVLLGYLLNRLPIADMWQQLLQLSPSTFSLSFLIFLLSNVFFALAWAIILHIFRFDLSIQTVGKLYFQSLFINNFASFIGGDSMRVYQVGRSSKRILDATLSVFISRVIMLYAILLLTGFMTGFWGFEIGWGRQAQQIGNALTILLLLTIPAYWWLSNKPIIQSILPNSEIKSSRISSFINKLSQVREKLQGQGGKLLLAISISLLAQLLSAWAVWILAMAMNMPVKWWQLLLFLSIIGVALILPISFNGIGLREVGLVGLLTSININGTQALALSISTSLLVILISLVGGISLLIDFLQTQVRDKT